MSEPAPSEMAAAIRPVIGAFDALGVHYLVGGSVASGVHGEARGTRDVDLVADLQLEHVKPFVAALGADYYVDEETVRMAVVEKSSFNLIHLVHMVKVDIFIPKLTSYARVQLERRIEKVLVVADNLAANVATAEDVILSKLDWYRLGGCMSDRQWNDILGVMKTQGSALDRAYLEQWAVENGVVDLLRRAFQDAGLDDDRIIKKHRYE